ncbi:bifunctional 4-hydroxy-2-oxoglutarate aldolase/2-dehydro-3-deoxy-phosphogluconate aldolase [Coralliovum pocilloporae]|uniref:bifunctional 4-hydroxy-2-oxoglutarate aldolase/2-dehydro-3-deoxy-phosphogluconate aldolase n=1 Tax=Coralliovum pocilloporae TaxID=3066369 RepID=UPI0033073606
MYSSVIKSMVALDDFCSRAPIIPVLSVERASDAVPLAKALIAGGLPVLEVTLRTDAALDVIRAMARVNGGVVGAGTVLTSSQAEEVKKAGARFCVSPGATEALLDACEMLELPLLAGAATASEVMRLMERGYRYAKFFPAEAAGGIPMLKSLNGPLPDMRFCPTGGLTPDNAADYLSLPNVVCAGGSWVAPAALVRQGGWSEIEALARQAAALR